MDSEQTLSVTLSIISAKLLAIASLIELQHVDEPVSDRAEVNFGVGCILGELSKEVRQASHVCEQEEVKGLRKRRRPKRKAADTRQMVMPSEEALNEKIR
ncbi:MAG: hypothetical protein HY537_03135 [Deltaproteobacteria bacterium]|nr:hypothetical protein [Deltaproteobacteria bacterium]